MLLAFIIGVALGIVIGFFLGLLISAFSIPYFIERFFKDILGG